MRIETSSHICGESFSPLWMFNRDLNAPLGTLCQYCWIVYPLKTFCLSSFTPVFSWILEYSAQLPQQSQILINNIDNNFLEPISFYPFQNPCVKQKIVQKNWSFPLLNNCLVFSKNGITITLILWLILKINQGFFTVILSVLVIRLI